SKSSSARAKSASSASSSSASNGVYGFDAWHSIAARHPIMPMKKSDKRHLHPFDPSSSKLGDMFGVVTNNDLTRSISASVRSIFKSKFSVPAYVASALLGAVALMAFYESPISPLPVPPLPEPPVGRFPPEMPIIPAGVQIPFRYAPGNQQQQQGYQQQQQYQRSSNVQSGPIWSTPNGNNNNNISPMPNQNAMSNQQPQQQSQSRQQQYSQQQPPTIARKSDVIEMAQSGRSLFSSSTPSQQQHTKYSTSYDDSATSGLMDYIESMSKSSDTRNSNANGNSNTAS
ncbi:hypothetical protein GZH46_02370, partial [Fragariocoptes setiger]